MAIERDLEQVHEHRPLGREPFGDRRDQPAVASDGEQVLVGMADEDFLAQLEAGVRAGLDHFSHHLIGVFDREAEVSCARLEA